MLNRVDEALAKGVAPTEIAFLAFTRKAANEARERAARFTLQSLQEQHGLLATGDMIWHEAMDRIPDENRAYIVALLRRGEKFNAEARIRVSTIHASKGGEADNVVLFSDATGAALYGNADDLHRLFYVGATRAKQNLYLVDPEDFSRSYSFDR
jgi:superfamily I DNA/RNA helicase